MFRIRPFFGRIFRWFSGSPHGKTPRHDSNNLPNRRPESHIIFLSFSGSEFLFMPSKHRQQHLLTAGGRVLPERLPARFVVEVTHVYGGVSPDASNQPHFEGPRVSKYRGKSDDCTSTRLSLRYSATLGSNSLTAHIRQAVEAMHPSKGAVLGDEQIPLPVGRHPMW